MNTTTELASTYVALWNEADADRRRALVAALWALDGTHVLQPPQEVRAIAAQPGIALEAVLQAQGHAAIEARAVSVHDHWVATEGLTFRGRDDADRLGDMVKLHWEAVAADGTVSAVGLSLLVLAGDGRIDRDYTFIVA
jgi:hypothetical protein